MTKRNKTALVLASGGLTGAVYEVGALRAINTMLVGHTVNDFDIYVGTSAGALINAFVASGFTPDAIMQVLDNRHPELRSFGVGDLFRLNRGEMARRLTRLPRALWSIGRGTLRAGRELALSDLLWELAQILPSGFYDGAAIEAYVRTILTTAGCANRFDALTKELYVVATELDAGARAVFSRASQEQEIVPISLAVAASSAVPVLYQPVQIYDRDYIDGGLHGAASLDLAIEAGAKLIVCINPMMPLDATQHYAAQHYIRKRGFQAIINQSVRTLFYSNVRYHVKSLRLKYPDVDIILIQPQPDDYVMFAYNPMHYRQRLTVAEHGYRSVTEGLQANLTYFQSILQRHGIALRADGATEPLKRRTNSAATSELIWPGLVTPQPERKPLLAELDASLDQLSALVMCESPKL